MAESGQSSTDPHAQIKADIATTEADDDVAILLDEQSCLRLAAALPPEWWPARGERWDSALLDYIDSLRLALRKYADHSTVRCGWPNRGAGPRCVCGLEDTFAEMGIEP